MLVDNDDTILFVNNSLSLRYSTVEIVGHIGYEVLLVPEDRDKIITANTERAKISLDNMKQSLLVNKVRLLNF